IGVFGKSSGIEPSLKLLDAAIAKKMPQLLPKLLSQWMKVYTAYKKTMEAAIKKEGSPDYAKDVTNILGVFLSSVRHEIVRQEAALWLDGDTVMTFEQAVGSQLFSDFVKRDPVVKFQPLQVWMADMGGIKVGSTAAVDAESARLTAQAKKHFKQRLTLLKEWSGLKGKTMKRSVALAKAEQVCLDLLGTWSAMGDGILGQIGEWTKAQEHFIVQLGKSNNPPLNKDQIKEDIETWQNKSKAWKAIKSLQPIVSAEINYQAHLADQFRDLGIRL
ncbi:hypothetical protein N9061_03105, partial [bacterium]|nr:hypothetical protein [bacterium]